jgi:hypothetical protein
MKLSLMIIITIIILRSERVDRFIEGALKKSLPPPLSEPYLPLSQPSLPLTGENTTSPSSSFVYNVSDVDLSLNKKLNGTEAKGKKLRYLYVNVYPYMSLNSLYTP